MKDMEFKSGFLYGYAYCRAKISKKEGLFPELTTRELALLYLREAIKDFKGRRQI